MGFSCREKSVLFRGVFCVGGLEAEPLAAGQRLWKRGPISLLNMSVFMRFDAAVQRDPRASAAKPKLFRGTPLPEIRGQVYASLCAVRNSSRVPAAYLRSAEVSFLSDSSKRGMSKLRACSRRGGSIPPAGTN
jgi:hypothetical protein